jgi:hypothetical protein
VISAGLAVAAALAAGPTPLLDAPSADSVALAGSEVVVTRTGDRGSVKVDAVPIQGGAPRRLLTAAGIGKRWGASAAVAASAQRVAVRIFYAKPNGTRAGGLQWRLYTGPLAGPLTLAIKTGPKGWLPGGPAVDGDRTLLPESRFTSTRARLLLMEGAAAPRVVPWGAKVAEPVALAGERVGYAGTSGGVFVADLQTGAQQLELRTSEFINFDLADDGAVVAEGRTGLVTAAPGVPRAALPGGKDLFLPRFAGERIAAVKNQREGLLRPVISDPGATAPRAIGVQTFNFMSLDADAQGAAYLANGCVIYAPVDVAAPPALPPGPCPRVEVAVDPAGDRMRGRSVRLRVICVSAPAGGCHGTARLRLSGPAGRKRFAVASGRSKVITVKLTRRAAKIVRRRVHAKDGALIGLRYGAAGARSSGPGIGFFINRVS